MAQTVLLRRLVDLKSRRIARENWVRALPLSQYREDEGPVLWWRFPVDEPPYVGSPLDTEWPGYHTHWTRIVVPDAP